jgi:hypothetical protein
MFWDYCPQKLLLKFIKWAIIPQNQCLEFILLCDFGKYLIENNVENTPKSLIEVGRLKICRERQVKRSHISSENPWLGGTALCTSLPMVHGLSAIEII